MPMRGCTRPPLRPRPVESGRPAHRALGPWADRAAALREAHDALLNLGPCGPLDPSLPHALKETADLLDLLVAHFAESGVPDPAATDLSEALELITKRAVPDPFRCALRGCHQLTLARAAFAAARRGNDIAPPLNRLLNGNRLVGRLLDRGHSLETMVTELLAAAVDAIQRGERAAPLPGDRVRPEPKTIRASLWRKQVGGPSLPSTDPGDSDYRPGESATATTGSSARASLVEEDDEDGLA